MAAAPTLTLQRVLPDGACCFRSVACSYVHALTGRNVGGGAPEGVEMTLRDGAANRVAEWVRELAARAVDLREKDVPCAASALERGLSLLDVVQRCEELMRRHGEDHALSVEDARRMREAWSPPAGARRAEAAEKGEEEEEEEKEADELLVEPGESVEQYAERMRGPHEWGGESDLYVLATRVLKMPVEVYVGAKRYGCYNEGAARHTVRVAYNGSSHFDAVLGADNAPPLLASSAGASDGC